MRKNTFLPVGIMAFIFTFLIGCNADLNLNPDTEMEKEQDQSQFLFFESSGCLNNFKYGMDFPTKKNEQIAIVSYSDKNEVYFTHYNTLFNCAAEIKVDIRVEGNTIFINEKDTSTLSANCECPYRLLYSVMLEEDGIYKVKLNNEEAFDFTFKMSEYYETTIVLRPYEGPDYDDSRPIFDFSCFNINFAVTDKKGNDLLNPNYSGNILNNNITVTYNGLSYKSNGIELRLLLPSPLAIRNTYSEYLNKYLLTFGEFSPIDSFKNETFTIDWGDGTKDVVKFDLYIEWPNMYSPVVINILYLNEKEVESKRLRDYILHENRLSRTFVGLIKK